MTLKDHESDSKSHRAVYSRIALAKDEASGYQEPIQSAPSTGSDPDVKNPVESLAVVLENVADDNAENILSLLVENVSGLSEKEFTVDLLELNTAVVTFKSPSAVGKFLEESRTHKKFKDYGLKARALERSTCIRVENLPSNADKMLLELYFEKWGGPIEEIITLPMEQAAIITFKNEEGKEKILKTKHIISDVPVKVYPYYKSLGTAVYGSNRPTLKLPEPFKVDIHPAIREFLFKNKLISSISDKMSSHFCKINIDKPKVLLSPDPALLQQKGLNRKHVDSWRKNASDAFENITSNYKAFEFQVSYLLWTKVKDNIKEMVKNLVFTDIDASKGVLTVAGLAHDVNDLRPLLEKMLERASAQMEKERSSVTEDMEMTPGMYFLLLQDGLQTATAASPQLRLDYNKKMNKLSLSGVQTEIFTFKNWVREKQLNIKQTPLKIDHSLLEFLKSVDCDEMSKDLFVSHGISAVYTVENGDLVLIGSTDRALSEAQERLNMVLESKDVIVEDRGVMSLPQWQDLIKHQQSFYSTSKKRTVLINTTQRDRVIVSGFKGPVMEISQTLGDFIEKHTRIEDAVRVKSHAVVEFIKERKSQNWQHFLKSNEVTVHFDSKRPRIKVSGERMSVQPAMTFFKKMSDALHADTLTIKKAGAKKYFKEEGQLMLSVLLRESGFVVVLQEDHMLEEEEEDYNKGSFEDFVGSCEVRTPGGVTVIVRKADICTLKVDAVVNAANEDLQHIGGLALALLQAAGPDLQDCCNKYIQANGRLRPGDAIITEAGHLPCKYVVHAVGPRYNSSDRPGVVQRLRSAVRESLKQASSKHCSSIAIPVISSGIFGCPLELCTEAIAREVREFIDDQYRIGSRSKLTEIHLVDSNGTTVNAMAQAVGKYFADFRPKMNVPYQNKPSGSGDYVQKGQGNHGHDQGYYGQRSQESGNYNNEPKKHGNRDLERQPRLREETNFFGGRSESFDGSSVLETKTTQGGLQLILSKGNIQDAKTDIIVNTISEDLDLNKGAISKALLQAAGHQLQKEVTTTVHASRLNHGKMVITDGYNLKCKRVFHVVCPFWKGGRASEDRDLCQIIRDCLKKAETLQMTSVSFPAIGTGNLGFPKDLVARIILNEVQEFTPQNLRKIAVIVHPSDRESLDCFTRIFRNGIQSPITKRAKHHNMPKTKPFEKSAQASGFFGKVSAPSHGVITMQIGEVTLQVSSGDITKEKTDAIVNSSNPTFSLKTGVSKAILDAAGFQVEQECLQIVGRGSQNFQQTEIVTSAGKLPCRKIIHIIGHNTPSEIRDVVLSVLKKCEANQLSSVAFPALGTGKGGAKPADVADAMVDAVVEFVKKNKPTNVKLVKFLIFQTSMVADFHQSMLKQSDEKLEEDKGFVEKCIDRAKELFWWETPKNEELVIVVDGTEPAVLQLCGETAQDLNKARDMVNNLILRKFQNTTIHDPAIGHFTKEDAEMLSAMQRELDVSIKLEKREQDSAITLEGLKRDVHTAESRIRDMIRKVERNERRRHEASLSSQFEWKYLATGKNMKSFDKLTNYDLEKAFQNKNTSVKIKIDNDEYTADLVFLQATRGSKQIELHRVDLSDYRLASHFLIIQSVGMEEYPYPIVVEGDWNPEHSKSLKNKLHIYFQSRKKSQGGDCVVQVNENSSAATVRFKSSEIRDDVLSKTDHVITFGKDNVNLKVSKPSDAAKESDSTPQLNEQASGYQEPIQITLPTESDPDVKNLEESYAVVLENVADDFTKGVLSLLVENVSGLSEKDFSMELIPELKTAVVTFNVPRVAGKFLEESKTHRKFKDYGLKARALERSTCIRVENLPSDANKMLLELYFEKWGGPVEETITLPMEQAAIITFKNLEDMEKARKMEHSIDDVPVKIHPYYKSLGTALYGSNRPTWKLPEPFKVDIHPAIRDFLLKKKLISSISDKMSSQFCQINIDKPEVLLSPDPALLKQKGLTRKHVDGWRKNASEAFESIISNYKAFELPVLYPLWTKVENEIKEMVKDLVFTHMDSSKGVLTVAGLAHDVNDLRPLLEKMLERASAQMEREKNSLTEDMEMTPGMYSLLIQDGLQTATAASPQLRLDYNKKINKLHLSGVKTEILTFKNWVLEKQLNMKQTPLKIDDSLLEFLRSVDCDEMSKDLFVSHGISAVYTVENGGLVLIGSTDRALSEAQKRLNVVLQTKDVIIEDQGVLALPQWHDLFKQLQSLYNTSKKRTVFIKLSSQRDKIIVSGFREPVIEISQTLGDFIEKHTRIEDAVRVKSHAVVEFIKERKSQDWQHFLKSNEVTVHFDSKRPRIKVSGERMSVQPAMTFFKKMSDALHADTLTIKKAGAKKYFKEEGQLMLSMLLKESGFVVVLQEDHMLEEEEEDYNKGSFEDFVGSCEVRMPSGITVKVRKADFCTLKVDAVVNAANEDLQHIGGLALALLQAAGPDLQDCCNRYIKVNGRLRPGDAIITEAGRLPCKYVVHAVGPRYNSSDKPGVMKHLRCAVRESLNLASGKHCSSIAIPVISSGIFGCPLELCTDTIAKEVREFINDQNRSASQSKLTEIHLVDNNGTTVNAMAQAVRKYFADFSPKMNVPFQSKPSAHDSSGDRGQGNRGRGYHGHTGQEFGNYNYEPKKHNNRDFERQAQSREETNFSGGRSESFDGSSVLETKTTKGGLKIILSKGNIQYAKTDVIVNTISEDLDLSKGAISKAILQAAGHRLQIEVTTTVHANRLNYGEMVITDGYNLTCAKVFHVVCPYWRGSEDRELGQIIRDCLKKADALQMTSVSFPAIGTGVLGFPKDLVARIILSEVQEFTPQNLREITVILHPSDRESLDCFTRIFRHGIQSPITKGARHHSISTAEPKSTQMSVSTPSHGVITMQVGQVTLEVSSGDITKERTDVIVNSSNHTFSLKTGVSKAILDAAGLQVERECLQNAAANNQQTEIVTSAGRLPCGNIIHIIGRNKPSEIKDVVLSVLKICEANQLSSVAFPALGTGQGGANPAVVADAMVDAVVDFVKKKKPAYVKLVKFLIFQTSMVADFKQSMLKRSGEKVEEEKGFVDKVKNWTKELLFGENSESPRNEEFVIVVQDIEPAVFQLCGETQQDLNKARDMINSLIIKEHMNIQIRDPAIGHFTREDAEMLNAMQRELTVSIKLDRRDQDPVIRLEGLTKDVHTAESRIRDMIRKVERFENRRREAFMINSLVEWKYLASGQNLKSFDMFTNYDLEKALQSKNTSVKIKIDNDEYTVDLVNLLAKRGMRQIELERVDLTDRQCALPSNWDDMKGKSVVLVNLTATSNEYADVEKEFRRTGLTSNIIQIERVQNSTLWKNYMIKKEELEAKNNHKNNEKLLFHGTAPDSTDHINHHGFNRSFAGTHGAMYGNGTYFAVDPKYSARGYSQPDASGHKRMYLARVLVGDFTQGKAGIVVPPAKSSNSADLYNSVTDNIINPSMFVIFNDVQAYPEYLITFQ
nr:protein mono-ADP-ribosyltransferase PARP14-like [Misgurnus anguillicaudatus]